MYRQPEYLRTSRSAGIKVSRDEFLNQIENTNTLLDIVNLIFENGIPN